MKRRNHPLGSKNRIWGLRAFSKKNTALNPAQAKFYLSYAGFWELQIIKKINLCGIKGDGFPPPKTVILRLLSYFSKKFVWKHSKRMRWTSLEYFSKTNRLQMISFLNSNFPRLFMGCHAFLQKQGFAKTRPKLEFLLLWTFKVLGFKQTFKWKYRSQKIIINMQKLQWSKIYLTKKLPFLWLCILQPFLDPTILHRVSESLLLCTQNTFSHLTHSLGPENFTILIT